MAAAMIGLAAENLRRVMPIPVRPLVLAWLSAVSAIAATPPDLARALAQLQQQQTYSWEVINADPGPQAQQLKTRRGRVTMVQQNTSPHLHGQIDRNGDTLIEREWADGVKLTTIILADGTTATQTPEGWMTTQEILAALGTEQVKSRGNSPRLTWLRRADRPEISRPDQELVPLINSAGEFTALAESYTAKGRVYPNAAPGTKPEDAGPGIDVELTLNLSRGLVRDYEVKVVSTRAITRARVQVPISDQRIVIITYLPVRKIVIPEEARLKLNAAKG
jgi:hypothetical protein